MENSTKLVFVTGGVSSSLGKGITAASLGRLLKARGYRISICKLDPYLNVDPGTMNPYQHGEVFVTDDGAETDLDIGHYERFIDETLTRENNTTSGQVYLRVIERERAGGYHGGTVQIIPHITDEIKARVRRVAETVAPDVLIVEIGGTVGDIESQPFLEAARQMKTEWGPDNCAFVHVTLVPYLAAAGELKSKPTQHSVKELLGIGIQPDILACRSERPIPESLRRKIGLFCNVAAEDVIENRNGRTLYEVPLMLEANGLCAAVCRHLRLANRTPDLACWRRIVERELHPESDCEIAIVGKYVELRDAYLSIAEALRHGGIANGASVRLRYVSAEALETAPAASLLAGVNGVLVPGGFGNRGLLGKMAAIRFAREGGVPFWASVSACRWPWPNMRETSSAGRTRTPRRPIPTPHTRSSISCPIRRKTSTISAARCALADMPAACSPARWRCCSTGSRSCGNATVTAMRSATTSYRRSKPPGCASPASTRSGGYAKSSSSPATRSISPRNSTRSSARGRTGRTRSLSDLFARRWPLQPAG